ncbi:MAG TPA: hypothetical protein VE643_08365 [Nitrososphaeraceae archaeon]|jgi:hypothetical protein|nr:hypothetical protein [Nitrososphaeraceae archaeon]
MVIQLDFGIGILKVTTPSTYVAVPTTFSPSLVEKGYTTFLFI